MVRCPTCGKDAWVVLVQRKGWDTSTIEDGSAKQVTYTYRRYRHYVGSRKSITLKALEKLLGDLDGGHSLTKRELLQKAKEKAEDRTVDHYVRV